MTKLIVAFRNFANAPNNDHKTVAITRIRGTCLSVGIAVSVPAENNVTKLAFLWNLIYRCATRALVTDHWKGYLWKSEGLSVETAPADENFHQFPIGTFQQLFEDAHSRQDCVWFMHCGDPSYASVIRTFLNNKYLQRWAYLVESIVWPAWWPDLKLLGFYLEGHSSLCMLWQLMVKQNQNRC